MYRVKREAAETFQRCVGSPHRDGAALKGIVRRYAGTLPRSGQEKRDKPSGDTGLSTAPTGLNDGPTMVWPEIPSTEGLNPDGSPPEPSKR